MIKKGVQCAYGSRLSDKSVLNNDFRQEISNRLGLEPAWLRSVENHNFAQSGKCGFGLEAGGGGS